MPTTDPMKNARSVLQTVFGYQDFIGKQEEVIAQLLAGGNALALMPTGGGKSLCYQLPALMRNGTGIVVSPLIALMKDQVDGLAQHNVAAAYLNSSQSIKQSREVKKQFADGELDLLYIAPERLISGDGLDLIRQRPIALVAIDEAHCISQWGHDFRREYLQLGKLAEILPDVPRLALTATADSRTKQEIVEKLHLQEAPVTIASFDRPNIRYRIQAKENTREQFLRFYQSEHHGQSGIIYCLTRRRTEETAQWLDEQGVRALPYHAGITAAIRRDYQEKFLREEGMVICATIAFGMGIDKPDVRFVAHFDLPQSMENYYQETGRAGRDGLPANALLFYSPGDIINMRRLLEQGKTPEHIRRVELQKLNELVAFCDASTCRRAMLLNYFDEAYTPPCDNCDNCLNPPELQDGTIPAQKFLSAVVRTKQLFGAAHIVDVLIGKETEKTQKFLHHKLPTFGIGNNVPAAQWRRIGNQLIGQGMLLRDEQYGALKMTDEAWLVLRGGLTVQLKREAKKEPKAQRQTARTARTQMSALLDEWQLSVFEALRAERRRLAETQNIPAYIVFQDTVLIELARLMPTTEKEFARIPGVGAAKVERYAKKFIKIIKQMRDNKE